MSEQVKKKGTWRSVIGLVVVLLAVPLTVLLGAVLQRSSYILVSVIIIVLAMVPFFVSFERRRPQARELVTLAVMIALAVASRAVFAFVPQFKPMAGIIMIAGIAFGASSGFLVGSLSAFVSNFIFGQGPWTPFQMLAFGLGGYLFGFLADRGIITRGGWTMKMRILVSIGGYLYIQCIGGPILDRCGEHCRDLPCGFAIQRRPRRGNACHSVPGRQSHLGQVGTLEEEVRNDGMSARAT